MSQKFIGVFDSGLGGLTCVKEIMDIMPDEPIVYFGDTGRVPYGSKSNETIIKYVKSDIKFLNTFDLKMIVVACGTASAIALPVLCDELTVPTFGVVDAAAREAVKATKNNKIGIIGTAGSIRSGAYEEKIKKLSPEIKTFARACPLFVPLVEEGYTKGEIAHLVAKEYLKEVKDSGVDTLILGCTHYPLLKETIGEIMGADVTLIDPGKVTASYVADYLEKENLRTEGKSEYKFFVSDYPDGFMRLAQDFLMRKIDGKIEKIDIEKYM
ncbi:MAG: glutamate racemase [Clostridia bacterium]|nr:glutamate racemase [Clostridia bacterium]